MTRFARENVQYPCHFFNNLYIQSNCWTHEVILLSTIKKIHARQVLDSRGNPTVGVRLSTAQGSVWSMVPSGASTGVHEAHELRDGSKRYDGKSVTRAVKNVNSEIARYLKGRDCTEQQRIDEFMIDVDGTTHKSRLGANAILAVSMAVCKAGAVSGGKPLYRYIQSLSKTRRVGLPVMQLNILNGGKHAGNDNDTQEHMILSTGFRKYSEALRASVEVYHELKRMLKKRFGASATLLGDEGGFVPKELDTIGKRLDFILKALKEKGYEKKFTLGLDCAASEFYYKDHYKIGSRSFSSGKLVDYYASLVKKYPISSIEDGMHEDDWEGWSMLRKKIGRRVQLVGDDLLVTNVERMQMALERRACNALLLKVNQIGTVTESIAAHRLALKNKWNTVVSHRSGETEDAFIADLVVGLNAAQSKFGAPARSERTAKYNRLLEIEEVVG